MHTPLHFYLTATYLSIFFNKMWNRNYGEDIFLSVKDFINTNINSWHLESKLEIINRDSNVYKHVYKDENLFFRLLKMDYGFSVFIFWYHGHALVQFWTQKLDRFHYHSHHLLTDAYAVLCWHNATPTQKFFAIIWETFEIENTSKIWMINLVWTRMILRWPWNDLKFE